MFGRTHGGNFGGQISATVEVSKPISLTEDDSRTSRGFGKQGLFGALSVGCLTYL